MRETEEQRTGRNKETAINHTYIDGGEYRKKFDSITENAELRRLLYRISKDMLFHRTGTLLEDMYWIDLDSLPFIHIRTVFRQVLMILIQILIIPTQSGL
jgi:hypothetical protein